jgi:hypothetical protein
LGTAPGLSAAQECARAAVVFIWGFLLIRFAGRRIFEAVRQSGVSRVEDIGRHARAQRNHHIQRKMTLVRER